jgi:hypothetical protein
MKTIEVSFRVEANCSMVFDVPDDYQIPSTNPEVFWEDLKDKAGDQFVVDPLMTDGACWDFPQGSSFWVDEVESVDFQRVNISEGSDKEYEIKLDHLPNCW